MQSNPNDTAALPSAVSYVRPKEADEHFDGWHIVNDSVRGGGGVYTFCDRGWDREYAELADTLPDGALICGWCSRLAGEVQQRTLAPPVGQGQALCPFCDIALQEGTRAKRAGRHLLATDCRDALKQQVSELQEELRTVWARETAKDAALQGAIDVLDNCSIGFGPYCMCERCRLCGETRQECEAKGECSNHHMHGHCLLCDIDDAIEECKAALATTPPAADVGEGACSLCDGDGLVVVGWDEHAYENIEGPCPAGCQQPAEREGRELPQLQPLPYPYVDGSPDDGEAD